jgi:hypothetical protein
MPVVFEENQGQVAKSVRFLARARGFNLFLTADEAVLALARPPSPGPGEKTLPSKPRRRAGIEMAAVRLRFDSANPNVRVMGGNRLKGSVNDYRGRDQDRWHAGIPTFNTVHYRDIHPGIDLRFTARDSSLAYSVLVRPGADLGALAISFVGAAQVALNTEGELLVGVAGQSVRLAAPRLYQWRGGRRVAVAGGYALKGATVRFKVGQYDPAAPLYIDPEISFSAYLYGSEHEGGLPTVTSSYVADALGLAAHGAGGTARAYLPAARNRRIFQPPARRPTPLVGMHSCWRWTSAVPPRCQSAPPTWAAAGMTLPPPWPSTTPAWPMSSAIRPPPATSRSRAPPNRFTVAGIMTRFSPV